MRLGPLIDSPEGARLFGVLVDETIAVVRALGAPIADDAREKVWEVARRMNISSSMAEDLAAGRPIELDAFTGFVVKHGRRLNVATPVSEVFYDLLSLRNPAQRSEEGR
jgi:2-dehydropantoate 2-reductase